MQLFKRQSDGEIVEGVRKSLKWAKRVAWIHFIVLLALAVFLPKFVRFLFDSISDMPNEDYRKWALSGLLFGTVMGTVLAVWIHKAAQSVVMGFDLLQINRKDTLLVKYHDMLKEMALQQGCEQHAGQVSSEAALNATTNEPSAFARHIARL